MLAAEDARQKPLLLFGRAVLDQERSDHHDALVRRACHAVLLEFLDPCNQLVGRQPHAAMYLGPGRRDPALPGQREIPLADLAPARAVRQVAQLLRIALLQEGAHHAPELGLGHGSPVGAARKLALPFGGAGSRFRATGECGMTALVRSGIAEPRSEAQRALVVQAQFALLRVADGAMQLHRRARGLQRRGSAAGIDATGFCLEPLGAERLARQCQHLVERGLRHFEVNEHVDAAVLQRLKAANGFAELRAGAQVGQCLREHRLPHAQQFGRLQDLAGRERTAQGVLRGGAFAQYRLRRQRHLLEAQVRGPAAIHQRHHRFAHALCAARHPQQHRIVAAARRYQPAAGRRAGQHHELFALQQHAAGMLRARLAAAGQGHGAQVARALLPGQRRQAAARHQLRQQRLCWRRAEPCEQQRTESGHRQQRLRRDVLARGPENLRRTREIQAQAARGFGGEHAGPPQFGNGAPALCLVGIGPVRALAPALDRTAANEVVERGIAHGGE